MSNFSKCDIAGAVALALIEDLRTNRWSFSGFPGISVGRAEGSAVSVSLSLSIGGSMDICEIFSVDDLIINNAARRFRQHGSYDSEIFPVVQEAISKIEARARRKCL